MVTFNTVTEPWQNLISAWKVSPENPGNEFYEMRFEDAHAGEIAPASRLAPTYSPEQPQAAHVGTKFIYSIKRMNDLVQFARAITTFNL